MTKHEVIKWGPETSPEPGTQEILRRLQEVVPPPLNEQAYEFLGTEDIPFARYTSHAFYEREMDHVWTKVWQWACRLEHIPEVGDYVVYDIGKYSVIVVRVDEQRVKAFVNSCLHRGTKLCASHSSGSKPDFRCPFHGWTWNLDGSLKFIPSRWDFQHVTDEEYALPEVKAELWGGFVFINLDPDARPLHEYLGVLPEHFKSWNMEDRYITLHIQKELPCNWKAAAEAFLENYHTRETHPQLLASTNEPSTQYDLYGDHISRFYALMGIQSPHLERKLSEQELLDSFLTGDSSVKQQNPVRVPEGDTARRTMANILREQFAEADVDVSNVTDSEILDTIEYTVFPNMFIFPGLSLPMVYRFRPLGDDPEKSLFDLLYLRPLPRSGERPEPPEPIRIGIHDSYTSVPGMDRNMGIVYDQDTNNLQAQQEGFHSSRKGGETLGNYQEIRIRHFHQTLDKYLAGEPVK